MKESLIVPSLGRPSRWLAPLLLCAVTLSGNTALALSPPWYLMQSQLKALLVGDPCVEVGDLQQDAASGKYELTIRVCDVSKGTALGLLMAKQASSPYVKVKIIDDAGNEIAPAPRPATVEDTAAIVTAALAGNRYFERVTVSSGPMAICALYPEFKPSVIQYWGDNLADGYGNINEVAAQAFTKALDLAAGTNAHVCATTSPLSDRRVP